MIKSTFQLLTIGAGCLAVASLFTPAASADDLFDNSSLSISAISATQLGRISRNGTQQTWDPETSGETTYPGAINLSTAFNYETFTLTPFQLGADQYIQIDIS